MLRNSPRQHHIPPPGRPSLLQRRGFSKRRIEKFSLDFSEDVIQCPMKKNDIML